MTELWKSIRGYERYYEVSNYGRVKSLARVILVRGRGERAVEEKILGQTLSGGYPMVGLSKGGKTACKSTHTLVWDAFGNGQRDGHRVQVDHINGNKKNNCIDNLQTLTNRQNIAKRFKQSGRILPTGVYPSGKKYSAMMEVGGKKRCLGTFVTPELASQAYQNGL